MEEEKRKMPDDQIRQEYTQEERSILALIDLLYLFEDPSQRRILS